MMRATSKPYSQVAIYDGVSMGSIWLKTTTTPKKLGRRVVEAALAKGWATGLPAFSRLNRATMVRRHELTKIGTDGTRRTLSVEVLYPDNDLNELGAIN